MITLENAEEPGTAKRPRNDRRRARNREALITAALDLTGEQGAAALTPAAIARRAGLHKQAFYVHFKSLDELMVALALRIAEESRDVAELRHAELVRQPVRDRDAELREICAQLEYVRSRVAVFRLLARERFNDGPVGRVVRETMELSRGRWTATLLEVALRAGIPPRALGEIQHLAAAVVDLGMNGHGRLIDNPGLSIEEEAQRYLRHSEHLVQRELRYLFRKYRRGD